MGCFSYQLCISEQFAMKKKKSEKKKKPTFSRWTRYSHQSLGLFHNDWVFIGSQKINNKTFFVYELITTDNRVILKK